MSIETRHRRRGPAAVLLTLLAACSSGTRAGDAAVTEHDGGVVAADAGPKVTDASEPPPDGGPVPPRDAGVPRASDAGMPPDAEVLGHEVHLALEQNHGLAGCYRCSLGAADFDGDGLLDIVMAGAFDSAFAPGMTAYTFDNEVRLYRNTSTPGRIQFSLIQALPRVTGGGGALVRVGDFDGDGRPDFAVQFREGSSPASDTSGFLNEGGWVFSRQPLAVGFDTNSSSLGMDVADFDGDGLDDLVFNSDGQTFGPGLWYKYHPESGIWEAKQTDFIHRIFYGGTIAAGDLDGDGHPEIIVGGNSSYPFGHYDCSSARIYGEIHYGLAGVGVSPDGAVPLGTFALQPAVRTLPCTGMDNASVLVTDIDKDGHLDLVIAGAASAFPGPPGLNGTHYAFVVLRNVDGTGRHFVTFENAGRQLENGTTNGGSGNVDLPNLAVGDLTGDGWPDVFMQGHHRDLDHTNPGVYVFDTRLFVGIGGTTWEEVDVGLPDVGEGGQLIEDFDGDGKRDLVFSGASLPFHSNGSNPVDMNDRTTIFTYVYRNTRP